jgi:hypothetical protein
MNRICWSWCAPERLPGLTAAAEGSGESAEAFAKAEDPASTKTP